MRNCLRVPFILGFALVLACAWNGVALAQGDAVAWTARLDEAQAAAHRAGKLVLVHFYGDHCAPCKRMDAEVFPSRGVVEAINRDYIPVKIDSAQSPEVVRRFEVRGIPADVILAGDGRVIHKREGGITVDRYTEYLGLVARRNQSPNAASSNTVPPNTVSPNAAPPTATMSLSTWGKPLVVESVPATPFASNVPAPVEAAARPVVEIPLALDGFCPVTLRTSEKWVTGNPLFYHLYRGQIYRFMDGSALERFCATPAEYAPVADGNDIVVLVEHQRTVPGTRRFGVWYRGRVFLFTSRASLEAFAKRPEFFAEIAGRYEASVGVNSVR